VRGERQGRWREECRRPGEDRTKPKTNSAFATCEGEAQSRRRCFPSGDDEEEKSRQRWVRHIDDEEEFRESHISASSGEVREKREEESRQRWVRHIDDEEEFRKSHISAVSREVREERERRKAANGGSDTLTTRRSKGRSWVFRFCCAAHRRAAAALSPA